MTCLAFSEKTYSTIYLSCHLAMVRLLAYTSNVKPNAFEFREGEGSIVTVVATRLNPPTDELLILSTVKCESSIRGISQPTSSNLDGSEKGLSTAEVNQQ